MKNNMKKIIILPVALAAMLFAGTAHASVVTGSIGGATSTTTSGVVVYAPTSNVASGTYGVAQNVVLNASGSDSIYYTIDGTTPTCGTGLKYSNAIFVSIGSNITMNAIACYGTNSSAVSSFTYSINNSGTQTDTTTTRTQSEGGHPTDGGSSGTITTSAGSSNGTPTTNTPPITQTTLTVPVTTTQNNPTPNAPATTHSIPNTTRQVVSIAPSTSSTSTETPAIATDLAVQTSPALTAAVAQTGFSITWKAVLIAIVVLGILGGAIYVNRKKEGETPKGTEENKK